MPLLPLLPAAVLIVTAVSQSFAQTKTSVYDEAYVRKFADAYGIEKSVVSEQFIEASRQKLRELIERPLGNLKLCAVMIDGIAFDGEIFVVALGIGQDGHKTVLGLRQGATENATVVGELCAELEQRGVDFRNRGCMCWMALRR